MTSYEDRIILRKEFCKRILKEFWKNLEEIFKKSKGIMKESQVWNHCNSYYLGIKFYGKIVYVTTTLPLVLLIVLTIFVLAQDGAAEVVKEAFSFKSKSFSRIYEVLNYEVFEVLSISISIIIDCKC